VSDESKDSLTQERRPDLTVTPEISGDSSTRFRLRALRFAVTGALSLARDDRGVWCSPARGPDTLRPRGRASPRPPRACSVADGLRPSRPDLTSEWPQASRPPLRLGWGRACDPHGRGHTSLARSGCGIGARFSRSQVTGSPWCASREEPPLGCRVPLAAAQS
jgi:hypothetical protein